MFEPLRKKGWAKLENGDLLEAAERAGFDLLITPDKNISYQQNLSRRTIAIVLMSNAQWPALRPHVDLVVRAVNRSSANSFIEVQIPVVE